MNAIVRGHLLSVDYVLYLFVCNDTATTEIYTYGHTLSLHGALPISPPWPPPAHGPRRSSACTARRGPASSRSGTTRKTSSSPPPARRRRRRAASSVPWSSNTPNGPPGTARRHPPNTPSPCPPPSYRPAAPQLTRPTQLDSRSDPCAPTTPSR